MFQKARLDWWMKSPKGKSSVLFYLVCLLQTCLGFFRINDGSQVRERGRKCGNKKERRETSISHTCFRVSLRKWVQSGARLDTTASRLIWFAGKKNPRPAPAKWNISVKKTFHAYFRRLRYSRNERMERIFFRDYLTPSELTERRRRSKAKVRAIISHS